MDDDHMAVWEAERETARDRAWSRWVDNVERSLGHSLDGNQATDGYSMDWAYEMWQQELTAREAAARVRASKAAL